MSDSKGAISAAQPGVARSDLRGAAARAGSPTKASAWVTAGTRNWSWLGERLDGWADLLEDTGDRAADVIRAFQERVSVRQLPNVQHESSGLSTGGLGGKTRQYQLVHTPTGAAVAVYIAQFGTDLYLAWDLFIRPVWNVVLLALLVGAAALLGFLQLGGRMYGFFSLISWLLSTAAIALVLAALVAGAGFALRRNPLAFFMKQLDAFDADDITAMTLAVHKSLLQAADAVGIDAHMLRVKEQFRGGRRDRLI